MAYETISIKIAGIVVSGRSWIQVFQIVEKRENNSKDGS
jgi:hypothetical protein